MPYITKERKDLLGPKIDVITFDMSLTVGDLTYIFYKLALNYIKQKGESFKSFAEVVSALECAKMEFYRRKVVPYENEKIRINGDV